MIFMNDTPKQKCEVKIENSTNPVDDKPNDGVTNEEQCMLLSGLFQDSNMEKNNFK